MKYIKTFENIEEPLKYLVELDSGNNDAYVWEIVEKIHDNKYLIKRAFQYSDPHTGEYSIPFDCDRDMLLKNVIYQTNSLEDAVEHLKIFLSANKYNL